MRLPFNPLRPSTTMRFILLAVIAALAMLAASNVSAQEEPRLAVIGERLFVDECAVCHGLDARGNGPLAPVLSVRLSDLTRAAEKNDGVFPMLRYYEIIDGRRPVEGHGPSEMPIWGSIFRTEVREEGATGGYRGLDAELLVAGRITAILLFLEEMQRP